MTLNRNTNNLTLEKSDDLPTNEESTTKVTLNKKLSRSYEAVRQLKRGISIQETSNNLTKVSSHAIKQLSQKNSAEKRPSLKNSAEKQPSRINSTQQKPSQKTVQQKTSLVSKQRDGQNMTLPQKIPHKQKKTEIFFSECYYRNEDIQRRKIEEFKLKGTDVFFSSCPTEDLHPPNVRLASSSVRSLPIYRKKAWDHKVLSKQHGVPLGQVVEDVRNADDLQTAVKDRLKIWPKSDEILTLLSMAQSDQMSASFRPGVVNRPYKYQESKSTIRPKSFDSANNPLDPASKGSLQASKMAGGRFRQAAHRVSKS